VQRTGFATSDLNFSWNLNLQPFNAHSWCMLWKFPFGWKYESFESLLFVIIVVYQRVQITHASFWYLNLKSLFELSTTLEVRSNNHKINIGIHNHIWIFKRPCMHCRAPTRISHFNYQSSLKSYSQLQVLSSMLKKLWFQPLSVIL
jgi:hypothetical protein